MTSPADALAALRDGSWAHARGRHKPTRLRVEDGRTLEVPGPGQVAAVFSLPALAERFDLFRGVGGVLARPRGAEDEPRFLDLVPIVEADLLALPERADAGRPYEDLTIYLRAASAPARAAYLLSLVAAVRALLPKPPRPPREREDRGPALTPLQRKAAERTRTRTAEEQSARLFLARLVGAPDPFESPVADDLDDYLDERPAPGERLYLGEAFEVASEALSDLGGETVDECGNVARAPGRKVFLSVARALLGPDRREADGSRYVVTPRLEDLAAPAVDPTVAEIRSAFDPSIRAALAEGHRRRALMLQRERLRIESTPGATAADAMAAISATP